MKPVLPMGVAHAKHLLGRFRAPMPGSRKSKP